jgi:predicted histidine transporter YuiF (NhaC family)
MKTPITLKEKIFYVLLAITSVMLLCLIVTLFTVVRKKDEFDKEYAIKLKSLEADQIYAQKNRQAWENALAQKDTTIKLMMYRDSLDAARMVAGLSRNYSILQQLKRSDDEISNRIGKLSSSELARAYADFK